MRPTSLLLLAAPVALFACTKAGAADDARGARADRASTSVPASTTIRATLRDSLHSRINKGGESVRATVATDVTDSKGRVVIAAGTPLTLKIVHLDPASDQTRKDGLIELVATSITLNGAAVPLHATVGPIPHHLQGRGITKDEAGRIAAGTAVGALIGQAIGKNTKSTVVGGAVGAVAGGAVAVRYAYRDVVIDRGATFTISLTQPLVVAN
jgi:hypothetical protein